MGKAYANVIYKKKENKEILYLVNFTIKTLHSIPYEDHIYIIEQKVKKNIETNNIKKDYLININYARAYFMEIITKNPYLQLLKIENDFIKKYKITEINSTMNEDIKINIKNK